ncbi:MAG: FAD:protein FMN transferase [Bacilli bacterium]|nr:FAD:protein FMN transferase [Bacilli bacterium]
MNSRFYNVENSVLDDVYKLLSEYNGLTDNYKQSATQTSVFEINESNEKIEISKNAYNMYLKVKELQISSLNYFNPLIENLSRLWKESLDNKEVLSETIISSELLKMNNSSFELFKENSKYYIQRNGEAKLDLGAFAKGYSLDILNEYFLSNEIKNYLIDAGNSSILLGEKPDNNGYFTVGLKDISNAYLELKDCFIGASGVSTQGVKINNKMYSHIINPFNGSAINNYDYVFVKGNNGALCDVLSTSFMIMDVDTVKEFEKNYNVEAILYKDSKIIYSNSNLEIKYH